MSLLTDFRAWLAKWIANEPCEHKFGKPYRATMSMGNGKPIEIGADWFKRCKLCGHARIVKRRGEKGAK